MITFAKGRGVELYDAAVSDTAVPPLPPVSVEFMMPRCLAKPFLRALFLSPYVIVRGLGLSRVYI